MILSGLLTLVFVLGAFKIGFSSSASIPRQQINDLSDDWQYVPLNSNSNCTIVKQFVKEYLTIPDLVRVSYFSDGSYLNATLWLSGPFEEIPIPIVRFPIYAMLIGIVQPYNTSSMVNYESLIYWNLSDSSWKKELNLVGPNNTKVLYQETNYKGFFDNKKGLFGQENFGHISVAEDLKTLSSPQQYFLTFLIMDFLFIKGNFCALIDISENTAYVPPPEFSVSASMSPIEIRQGEEKTIELRINSSALVAPNVTLSTINDTGDLKISFEPNKTQITSGSLATSLMKISAPEGAKIRPYTIPVYSTIIFPSLDVREFARSLLQNESSFLSSNKTEAKIETSVLQNESSFLSSNKTEAKIGALTERISTIVIPRPSYVDIIVKSYPFEERFKDFWTTYGGLFAIFGGAFAAGLAALVFDKIRSRRRRDRDQTTFDFS